MRKKRSSDPAKARTSHAPADKMRPDYDFSHGVRGATAQRFARVETLVLIDPDLSKLFPDSASVNRALRALAEIALSPTATRASAELSAGTTTRKAKPRRRAD